jgi:hypothetical protein
MDLKAKLKESYSQKEDMLEDGWRSRIDKRCPEDYTEKGNCGIIVKL